MLILSRKPGEAIAIDNDIRVVVLASDHRGVRLGIEAPPSVRIVREEIVQRIADENRRAGATAGDRGWVETLEPSLKGARRGALQPSPLSMSPSPQEPTAG